MTEPKSADWIAGMRELIAWLEQHPDVDLIRPPVAARFRFDLGDQDVQTFALRHGLPVDHMEPRRVSRTETVHEVECRKPFGLIVVNARTRTVIRKSTLRQRIKAVFS